MTKTEDLFAVGPIKHQFFYVKNYRKFAKESFLKLNTFTKVSRISDFNDQ